MALTEFKVQAMRQSIAESILRALLDGDFQPGEDLSENALAAQLKVSRGPVREALLVLAQEGLLTHTQNRGFRVLQLSDADIRQIQTVRLPLESLALQLARERISAAELDRLDAYRDEMVPALRDGDRVVFLNRELNFHSTIWEASGNAWLVAALRRVVVPYFAHAVAYKLASSANPRDLHYVVHDLFIRFLRGDCDWPVERCVALHIDQSSVSEADLAGLATMAAK
jgi:DNA-binding GntR family transcriptional regulator